MLGRESIGRGRSPLWRLGPGLAPALAAMTVFFLMKYLVHPASWLSLGLCAASGLAVYTGVLFAFCAQPADREDLRSALNSVRKFFRMVFGAILSFLRPG